MNVWDNATVLVTGGSGSFGRAFVAHALAALPIRAVRVYSRDELKQAELAAAHPHDQRRLSCLLGDVRDRARLALALRGVDLVVHAAAMKRIEACEYNPGEAAQTNALGALNLVHAAITAGVSRVVALSTDKACVDYHSPVAMLGKRAVPINRLVAERREILVQTLDGDRLSYAAVVGWYKKARNGAALLRVGYEHGRPGGVWVTEDHRVLTPDGWRASGELRDGDLLVTAERAPNDRQMALVCGMVLGDASLVAEDGAHRATLRFGHSEQDWEWLALKVAALADLGAMVRGAPRTRKGGGRPFRVAAVTAGAVWSDLRAAFYPHGRKVVPRSLIARYLGPELLAAWYMDDGCLSYRNARFATHGFVREDAEWLAAELTVHGMSAHVLMVTVQGTAYPELRLTVEGTRRLFDTIGAFVPPALRRKLLATAPPFREKAWLLGDTMPYVGRAVVRQPERVAEGGRWSARDAQGRITGSAGWAPRFERCVQCGTTERKHGGKGYCTRCYQHFRRRDVYCIDVEGTHNFVVNGVVLHNCNPLNCYGASKLLGEKLFCAGNHYAGGVGPRFACTRWGNVLASRGSVVPVWLAARAAGAPLPLTGGAMTRFWITLPQTVAFVVETMQRLRGGEVWVPDQARADLATLAAALCPGWPTRPVARRPGEKSHELLISPEEGARAARLDGRWAIEPEVAWWEAGGARAAPGLPDPVVAAWGLSSAEAPQATVPELQALLAAAGVVPVPPPEKGEAGRCPRV